MSLLPTKGDPLALRPLVAHGVSRALADGLPFPLAHADHDVQDESTGRRARIGGIGHTDQRHIAALEAPEQFGPVDDRAREAVDLPPTSDASMMPRLMLRITSAARRQRNS